MNFLKFRFADLKRSVGLGPKKMVPKLRRNKGVKKILSTLGGSDKGLPLPVQPMPLAFENFLNRSWAET